jgi:hypothetical protein
MPPMLPSERWALTPPFHPCQMRWPEDADLRFCLAAAAEAVWFALAHHHRSGRLSDRTASRTGGFFSVALAVAFPMPKHRNDPLALPGALPFCPRPCGFRLCGVRTFLPSGNLVIAGSAITRPARQIHYTRIRGFQKPLNQRIASEGRVLYRTGPGSDPEASETSCRRVAGT